MPSRKKFEEKYISILNMNIKNKLLNQTIKKNNLGRIN